MVRWFEIGGAAEKLQCRTHRFHRAVNGRWGAAFNPGLIAENHSIYGILDLSIYTKRGISSQRIWFIVQGRGVGFLSF